MDGILFEEWVRKLDRKFLPEGRNVALVIDICHAHPHIENLKAIKLFSYLRTQLQGVMRALKTKYRTNVVRKIIRSLEKNNTLPKISLLHGMQMLVSTWNALTTETIVNYFRKAGISAENQDAAKKKMILLRTYRMELMLYDLFNWILFQRVSTQLR